MKNLYQDTIVAPATTPGTGAISIVRLSGPECFRIVDAVVQLRGGTVSEANGYTIHFGSVYLNGQLLDDVLVSVFRAPHSYTGEDAVEISTHASAYIVTELIRLLITAGARMAQPGEFTRRAYINGKMDLAQAEAVADVISSTTLASHRVAMNQLKGSVSKELSVLRERLLEMASLMELELDFSEEDVEFANREQLLALVGGTLAHVRTLAASFRQGNMIKSGVPVAIVGPPNAGKSSLLNALLEEDRALVSDIPGTTRDTVEEALQLGGILFRFIDTAGIRQSADVVENLGIDRTFQKISQAEIVLFVLDATQEQSHLTNHLNVLLGDPCPSGQKVFLLLNKTDLLKKTQVNKIVTQYNNSVLPFNNQFVIIPISIKERKGIQEVKDELVRSEQGLIANADSTFITNERHYQALQKASEALQACRNALSSGIPTDLVAEDLRRSISAINEILGTGNLLSPDTILHSIFSRHCIGK